MYLPSVRYVVGEGGEELCARSYGVRVYFERCGLRLDGVKDLPFLDGMYMVRVGLEGFRVLGGRFGWFGVREDMVFID